MLKFADQLKSSVWTKSYPKENSTPWFTILESGKFLNFWDKIAGWASSTKNNKSCVSFLYTSILPESLSLLKPKSNPVAYCNVDSHLRSLPPNETIPFPPKIMSPFSPGFNPPQRDLFT